MHLFGYQMTFPLQNQFKHIDVFLSWIQILRPYLNGKPTFLMMADNYRYYPSLLGRREGVGVKFTTCLGAE